MAWSIEVAPDSGRVLVTFRGHLAAEDGRASAQAFHDALATGPRDVVWDLREMADYEGEARAAWQKALWPVRKNVKSLAVVGARPLIRFGAVFLASLIGAPWRLLKSMEEL
ncbi:MAG TPA: STAS/SEC14 domain-containing protein [Vicinamibacteria bacterium]|nr:STAS/SEC14 domain-containing protein [Vicinamibacteria bacterium]